MRYLLTAEFERGYRDLRGKSASASRHFHSKAIRDGREAGCFDGRKEAESQNSSSFPIMNPERDRGDNGGEDYDESNDPSVSPLHGDSFQSATRGI